MRLTRASEYALRAMRFLASRSEGRWFAIQEIADAEELPSQFLAKVMQHLTQAGLVHSACGKTGGYRLGRPAADIRIADVILAMEGPLSVNNCLLYPEECKFVDRCKMHPIWEEVQATLIAALRKYSLADVAITPLPSEEKPKPRRSGRRSAAPKG